MRRVLAVLLVLASASMVVATYFVLVRSAPDRSAPPPTRASAAPNGEAPAEQPRARPAAEQHHSSKLEARVNTASATPRSWDEPPFDTNGPAKERALLRGRIEGLREGIPWAAAIDVYDAEESERQRGEAEERWRDEDFNVGAMPWLQSLSSAWSSSMAIRPNDDGSFEANVSGFLERTRAGHRARKLRVEADAPFYTPTVAEIEVADGQLVPSDQELVLRVAPAAVLTGFVDTATDPIAGVLVVAVPESPVASGPLPLGWAVTDEQGGYWLRVAHQGTVRVVALGPHRPDVRTAVASVGTTTIVEPLRVDGGVQIAGTVNGSPGVRVRCRRIADTGRGETIVGREILRAGGLWVYRSTATTARSSGFLLPGLAPGEHEIVVVDASGLPSNVPATRVRTRAPAHDVIVPANLVSVRFRATPDSGIPVFLRVTRGTQSFGARLNPDFESFLTPGVTYQLEVEGTRIQPAFSTLSVPSGVDRLHHELELRPLEPGTLQLDWDTPNGLSHGLVSAHVERMSVDPWFHSDLQASALLSSGRPSFNSVEPGGYEIRLKLPSDFVPMEPTPVHIKPGATVTKRIPIVLSGRVLARTGANVPEEWRWELWNANGELVKSRRAHGSGSGGIPPGCYWFLVRANGECFSRQLDVEVGAVTTVHIGYDELGWDLRVTYDDD